MSANFRCHAPTGQVLFDVSMSASRLLAVFGFDVREKTHTFSDDEMGGGTLFWYATNPSLPIGLFGGQVMSTRGITIYDITDRQLSVLVTGNQIYFKKSQNITLFVGVRI